MWVHTAVGTPALVAEFICYILLSAVWSWRCPLRGGEGRENRERESSMTSLLIQWGGSLSWQGLVASELKLLSLGTNQDCQIDSAGSLCSERLAPLCIHSQTSNDLSCSLDYMLITVSTVEFSREKTDEDRLLIKEENGGTVFSAADLYGSTRETFERVSFFFSTSGRSEHSFNRKCNDKF